MAKGYQGNREHLDEISTFGKAISKRADFTCEWCDSKDELRVWDYAPDVPPNMDTLALLCQQCRGWADGRKASADELRSIRNALWSNVPAVAEGAAKVLARYREPWVREAIEESLIADDVKAEILQSIG